MERTKRPYSNAAITAALEAGMRAAVDHWDRVKAEAAEHRRVHGRPRFDPEAGEFVDESCSVEDW